MEPTALYARTPLQRLLMEQALAMAEQLEAAGDAAPDGQVLDRLEGLAVQRGREFTRQALEGALQRQVEDVEKKLLRAANVPADVVAGTKARRRARS
jgi:hypothetical protein